MAGLCEGGNEPPGSLKAITIVRKQSIVCGFLEKELRKRLVKCFVWSVALYGSKTWTLRRSEEKRVEAFEMWIWTRMERFKWTDRSLMLAGNEFQSLGRAIVKEDEYEEVRWDGIVSIVSWRERVFRLWWEESWLFNDAVFSVDEIGDSEMAFGEMTPRIRHRLPGIHLTVRENLGKNSTRMSGTEKNSLRLRDLNPGFQLYVLTLYPLSHTGFPSRCRIESSQFKFYLLGSL
ncbi:hypothetical protein ANN_24457 [Periplaneta americana]|uniref:Uncharacterized protein n=1 Tax=Periplaneta americana TaxID=6978 RepID=A0ABQ8S3K1_PERAM|nr:hypothetical protein ANN_24457 [Periplaneta americana]